MYWRDDKTLIFKPFAGKLEIFSWHMLAALYSHHAPRSSQKTSFITPDEDTKPEYRNVE